MSNILHKLTKNRIGYIKMPDGGSELLALDKTTLAANAATTVETFRSMLKVNGTPSDGFGQYWSFYGENDAGEQEVWAKLEVYATDVSNGTEDVAWKFYNLIAGTMTNTLTITSAGSLSGVGDLTFAADQDVTLVANNASAWDIKDAAGSSMVFTTTTGSKKITVSDAFHLASGVSILPDGTNNDLGGTSNEMRKAYFGDSGGIYLGADQDCNILHDGTKGMQLNLGDNTSTALEIQQGTIEYVIIDSTDNAEVLTLGCTTADTAYQNTTIQAGNNVAIYPGTAAADTVVIYARDVDGSAYDACITVAGHATDPTVTIAADGGITMSNNVTMASGKHILPADNTCTLGSTSYEWGGVFLGDSKAIQFGADQDATIAHANTSDLVVNIATNSASAFTIKDKAGSPVSFFSIDTTTATPLVNCLQHFYMANNMDILPATAKGSDLGSTSAEWGSVYLGSGKGVYFGDAQEANILEASGALQLNLKDATAEAFSIQTESGASEYFIITTSDGAETVSLGCTTADEVAQDTTVQAGNDLTLKCGTSASDVLNLQAYDGSGTPAYDSLITLTSSATAPSLSFQNCSGGITFTLVDNVASAISVVEGSNKIFEYVSTNNSEALTIGSVKDITISAGTGGTIDINAVANVATAWQVETGTIEYMVLDTTTNSEVLTLGCSTADQGTQNTVIQAGNNVSIYPGTANADTLILYAYDTTGAYDAAITITSAADPTIAIAADGGITLSNAVTASSTIAAQGHITMAAGIDILCTDTNSDLGSTTSEWGNIYVGDSKGITFGADQDGSLLHDGSTGIELSVADGDADAFEIKEGSNSYFAVDTRNDAENCVFNKPLKFTSTTVDMANAKHTMVFGTAGGNQTKITGNVWFVDPNGGAQTLVLPTEATMSGFEFTIINTADAGETITIKDDAEGYTVIVLDQNQAGKIVCDGTTIYGFMGAET